MTQTITLYRIFVASPSDVKEERLLLEEAINEINLSTLFRNNIRAELVKWETHVNPGIGDYPQKVVNDAIGDNYDIFLGIFWSKFGSPTQEYNSGTEEELYNAIRIHKEASKPIKIMMYFRQTPVPIEEIDTVSIGLIRKLRSDLKTQGILYQDYSTIEEFQKLIRIQLSRQIIDLSENHKVGEITLEKIEQTIVIPREELGLLDYLEQGEESFSNIKDSILRMSEAIGWMGKKFIERTEEINLHTKLNPNLSTKTRIHLIDLAANDLDSFVNRLNVEIPIFAETYRNGIDNFSNVLKISMELKSDELEDIEAALQSMDFLINTMSDSRSQCADFRDMFTTFPSMTKNFNQAKRLSAKTIDDLIKEFDIALNLTMALRTEFIEYRKKY
jgi:hypothetical protein